MPFDPTLAERVRERLGGRAGFTEKRMFGGLAFLYRGHMCCGILGDELIVRLGPEGAQALEEPHTRPFDFTGKAMSGWAVVAPAGIDSEAELDRWVARGVRFASTLPPK